MLYKVKEVCIINHSEIPQSSSWLNFLKLLFCLNVVFFRCFLLKFASSLPIPYGQCIFIEPVFQKSAFFHWIISSIFIIQAHALTLKSSCCHASQLGPSSALPVFSQQMHHLFAFSSAPSKTVFLLFSHPNSLYNYINHQCILHLTNYVLQSAVSACDHICIFIHLYFLLTSVLLVLFVS